MSDKRIPKYTILLRKEGNKKAFKMEMFPAKLWKCGEGFSDYDNLGRDHFRLRVDGYWWPKGEPIHKQFFTKTYIKELFFKAIKS